MAHVDRSRWVCLYPIYINSKKTVAQGRKIPQSKAVEDPELHLICESIAYLKLPLYPEPEKGYSRDFFQRGRVKVLLKKEDGSPINSFVPDRKALYTRVAALVAKHEQHGKSKVEEKVVAQVATPQEKGSSSATQEKKPKNKKKKK